MYQYMSVGFTNYSSLVFAPDLHTKIFVGLTVKVGAMIKINEYDPSPTRDQSLSHKPACHLSISLGVSSSDIWPCWKIN